MKSWSVFIFEWKHFVRSPFKVLALFLFLAASLYGLHNGIHLYQLQLAEIENIKAQTDESLEKTLAYYRNGEPGPSDRSWVNVNEPFWAMWYSESYVYKKPSPTMIYSIGQAEQYGFYKRLTFYASSFDADMAEEIANPERLQIGTLDFSFSILFLSPLLLLILSYHLKASESEKGFLPLIEIQLSSKSNWLLSRLLFYFLLQLSLIFLLIGYGAWQNQISLWHDASLHAVLFYTLAYQLFWGIIYFLILSRSQSVLGNTLSMAGIFLLITFIVPGTVHQLVSMKYPVGLMLDYIDTNRDEKWELYDQPDSLTEAQLFQLYPQIAHSPATEDSTLRAEARSDSYSALANKMIKEQIKIVEEQNEQRNQWIAKWHWVNPLGYFQNQLNKAAGTHYNDYKTYRDQIQAGVDAQNRTMVIDTWNNVKVDEERFLQYRTQ